MMTVRIRGCGFNGFGNLSLSPLKTVRTDSEGKRHVEEGMKLEASETQRRRKEEIKEHEEEAICIPRMTTLLSLPVATHSSLQCSASWDSLLICVKASSFNGCYSSVKWYCHFIKLINEHCLEDELIEKAFEINNSTVYVLTTHRNGYIIEEETTGRGASLITINKLETSLLHYCQVQSHRYCLTTNGEFRNCGRGLVPVAPPLMTRVTQVSNGLSHALILMETGLIYSIGLGSHGQLGLGDLDSRSSLNLIEGLAGIRINGVSCGYWHCLVVSSCGDMYSWGWNRHAQLGHSHTHSIIADPTLIEEGIGEEEWVETVSCGSRHSSCVTKNRKCYMWGWNVYGQLGLTPPSTPPPSLISIPTLLVTDDCVYDSVSGHWNTIIISS